jgi:TatD DNase family protein
MFIDSHAHLDGPRFDPDRAEVIARARAAGVSTILAIGIGEGPGTLDCAVKLAAQYPFPTKPPKPLTPISPNSNN